MVDASTVAGTAKWIASSLIKEGQYLYGVEDIVYDLQRHLECMQVLLQTVDADPSLVKEDGQLRIFTKKLRELAFRAEDAIDTYIVDVGAKAYMKNFFVKLANVMSHPYALHMLRMELEAIQQEIQDAHKRFETYGLLVQNASGRSQQYGVSNIGSRAPPAENFIHLDDVVVVGIDDVITKLANRLTDLDDDFRVLGIVGTGGAGKSTLATQLFQHNRVASVFPHRAFVSVSQRWNRIDLLQRIYKQIKGDKEAIPSTESEIVKELYDFMKGRQCLVVLDDIWKKEAWDDIYPILPCAKKVGCRVILTTRIEEVPLYADNKCIIHNPQLLNEDQKWALFSKIAMEGRPHIEKSGDQYEKLGRQMLGKCQGLPLAIVTLAGILQTKRELYEWEDISKACRESILKGKGSPNYGVVKNMLELSYLDMPAYLKPCFLYLAIFPEDYDIEAYSLIRMWVGEGFITNGLLGKGQGTLEDEGLRLLSELTQRCILQVTRRNARGQIKFFRLHDLMRELCLEKAEECQFVGTISSEYPVGSESNQPRRVAVYSRRNFPTENPSLRTFVDFDKTKTSADEEVIIRNTEQLGHCKLLRVLSMERGTLPKRIGKLVHLRFLSIVESDICDPPKSIKNLRNLLYLWYASGKSDAEVPNDLVCNMENLRELVLPIHLKRGGSSSFNRAFGLSGCKKLQSLNSGAGTWMVKDLPTLSLTVRSLVIYCTETKKELEAIYKCPSIVEDHLHTLECLELPVDLEFDLQKIRHCKTLWSLKFVLCRLSFGELGGALEFPPNLAELWLSSSTIEETECDIMQVLGELSCLKTLTLANNAYMGKRLSCKASAFPQLQELALDVLPRVEEWIMEEGAMPRLTKLKIEACRQFKKLPQNIRSITTLKELEVAFMPEEFCKRLGYGEGSSVGDDCYLVQHIPSVKFSYVRDWF